jgi:MFS family permease
MDDSESGKEFADQVTASRIALSSEASTTIAAESAKYEDDDDEYTQDLVPGWRTHLFYARIASWWCGVEMCQTALFSVVFPAQIAALVSNPVLENLYNGFIPAPGAFIGLIICPIFGVFSDYSTHWLGRRKVFLVAGSVIVVALMLCLAPFNVHSAPVTVYAIMVLICVFQFGAMVGTGPFTGLIPDLVKKKQIGIASGWLGAGYSFGSVIGLIGTGLLVKPNYFWNAYIFLVVVFIAFCIPTIVGLREIPRPPPAQPLSWKLFAKSFILDPKIYGNFYLVIVTRCFFTMGLYMFIPFYQYFFKGILRVPLAEAPLLSSLAIALLILVGIPSTLIAGKLSDKHGRKAIVYSSLGLMCFCAVALAIVSYYPNLAATFIISAVLGVGYGAFVAVDWAIALDTVPPGADIAKDLGIWHLGIVVPNVIAPVIAGAILTSVTLKYSSPAGYCTLFMVACGWWIVSILFFIPVKLTKKQYV